MSQIRLLNFENILIHEYPNKTFHTKSIPMFAKVKSTVFIDSLKFELTAPPPDTSLKAILRDDKGCVCSTLEAKMPARNNEVIWRGLNNLPYGVYTLELTQGQDEMKMKLVKRI